MADFGIYRGFSEKLFEGQTPVNVGKEGSVTIPSGVAPVALEATGIGSTSFTANWEAFPGAYVYLLDVSTSPTFDTFVYENQQVNAPSTSYVVIGLESNTTYYYRVRASTEALIDPDAQAFFDRVTTAGGSLSTTEQEAVNTLVVQMKADGIWTAMKAIYPMVGGSASSHKFNLKDPRDLDAAFRLSFSTGWTHSSNGAAVTAKTATYADTYLSPSTHISTTSGHLCYYANSLNTADAQVAIGNGAINDMWMGLYSSLFYGAVACNYQNQSYTSSAAFYLVNKNSSTELKFIKNSSILGTKSVSTNSFSSSHNLLLNNYNEESNFTCISSCAFASIGDGLTDTEASDFYTAVQAFQTTLSRNV